jgi:hypothetical protein
MHRLLITEADDCGPLSEPFKTRCQATQGINNTNGQKVVDWCSTNLQKLVNGLPKDQFTNTMNGLWGLFTQSPDRWYGYVGEGGNGVLSQPKDWDMLLHVCNTGDRYTVNPPKKSSNKFVKPVSAQEQNKKTQCPTDTGNMRLFAKWLQEMRKNNQINSSWDAVIEDGLKNPCGPNLIAAWNTNLNAPYPKVNNKEYKTMGGYWWAYHSSQRDAEYAKKQQQQQASDEKAAQDKAMGRTAVSDANSNVTQSLQQQGSRMVEYKNTLGKMTPAERDAFVSKLAKESNFNWDLLVDLISAACELIPGLGSAASLGIDIIHGIVNLMQGLDGWESIQSVEKLIDGFVGLLTSMFPAIGNTIKMGFSALVKRIIKNFEQLIEKLALGNLNFFQKLIWALLKRAGEELGLDKIISSVTEKLAELTNTFKDWSSISGPLSSVLEILNPVVPFEATPLPDAIKNIR